MMKTSIKNGDYLKSKQIIKIILPIAILNFVIYLFTLYFTSYGIFRDEFYYLACANRPAFGYVDQPPLTIWILAIWKFVFGDSLYAIRFIPAIVSSLTISVLGLFTIKLGGSKSAVIIAMLTFMFTPIFMGMNTTYSMDVFDFFFWILSAFVFLQIVETSNKKLWYLLGIIIGIGLLNKISMFWLGAGLFAGTLFTPKREDLKTKYPYIAAGIALLVFSPYIIWNITHDFSHIEFMRNATQGKYGGLTPVSFITSMFFIVNPLAMIIWIPGIIFYFFNKNTKIFRPLGYIWLVTFIILIINWHSKATYLAPAFQILFAGGAVQLVSWNRINDKLKYALVTVVIVFNLLLSPYARPLLPPQSFLQYQSAILFKVPNSEGHESVLPQHYADMFGWESLARDVSKVYQTLPDEEKKRTVVYCSNYGEAGAIEYFAKKYPLPKVICPHNSYWYWWSDKIIDPTIIIIGGTAEQHLDAVKECNLAAVHKTQYVMPYENNLNIFIARGLKMSLEKARKIFKNFS